ncbi:MAG: DUF4179 domain-containing protein [Clostridia bacterium]|nr:DUF4179 domain-containing protein [Clostridia bacterium]
MKRNLFRVALIAALILAALCTAAYALTRPAVIDWLLPASAPASPQLTSTAQDIHTESTLDGVTVRLTGLVYDGTQLAFSYEAEVADPAQPALVLLSSDLTVAGQPVGVPHYVTNASDARLVPSPHLDVLPVQRNPLPGGGWSNTIDEPLTGMVTGEAFFDVYRPEKGFAVLIPADSDFYDEGIDGEYRAELDDALATLRSFPDVLLVDGSEDIVFIDDHEDDAEIWAARGYTVLGQSGRVIFPVDDPRCHVMQTARIAVPFAFDADNAFACDFSGTVFTRADCTVQVEQLLLTPLVTRVHVRLIPAENTEASARALAEACGPFTLTDGSGLPVTYSEMDTMYSMYPTVACRDGQWLVRYLEDLPGLQEFPASIGFTVQSGDLARFDLPTAE